MATIPRFEAQKWDCEVSPESEHLEIICYEDDPLNAGAFLYTKNYEHAGSVMFSDKTLDDIIVALQWIKARREQENGDD